jgi:hypothetical protein
VGGSQVAPVMGGSLLALEPRVPRTDVLITGLPSFWTVVGGSRLALEARPNAQVLSRAHPQQLFLLRVGPRAKRISVAGGSQS